MDKSRNYILDRITSRKTSIEEFNFDKLEAPPLSWFFSPFDINELNSIARSLKYSAKPQLRYEAIDRVCKRCGLVKFAAGTNRVVYRHPEFQNILFKIASDDIGLGDNPAEFRNQFILKPFVAKTFEISPCGTVAISERVNPITSREEYISVADDVFTLITEWLIGKYVLADIGSRYFMNVGVRAGFGVVLLDYPYLYELDGDKIFCNKPDPLSPSGKCDGEIDYDDGFNFLCCTKCGRKFKAKELEKQIKDSEIIVEREGEIKMNIKVKGGSKNINKSISTESINNENFLNVKSSIHSISEDREVIAVMDVETGKITRNKNVVISNNIKSLNEDNSLHIKVKRPVTVKDIEGVDDNEEKSPEVKHVDKFVNGVSTNPTRTASPAFTISDEVQEKALAAKEEKEEEEKNPVQVIDDAVNTILENFDKINIEAVKNDSIVRVFDALAGKLPVSVDSFRKIIRLAHDLLSDADEIDGIDMSTDDILLEIFKMVYSTDVQITSVTRNNNDLDIEIKNTLQYIWDTEDPADVLDLGTTITTINGVYNSDDESEGETSNKYEGISLYNAKIIDIKDLFPSENRQDIVVMVDENGNYATRNNNIIAANTINDQTVGKITTVSKAWVEEINKMLSEDDSENVDEDTEIKEVDSVAGILPPTEGITTKEFLENENAQETE